MWGSSITQKRLMQNINQLRSLNQVPEEPAENPPVLNVDTAHQLTIDRENEIVSNLAFLSAITDNYLEVMAACVEEDESGEAITVRIASNSGDLSVVVEGLTRLARVLEQAARRG